MSVFVYWYAANRLSALRKEKKEDNRAIRRTYTELRFFMLYRPMVVCKFENLKVLKVLIMVFSCKYSNKSFCNYEE